MSKPAKLILVGPLPTSRQITGQAVAFRLLVDSLQEDPDEELDLRVINIAGSEGDLWFRRTLEYFGIFARYARAASGRPGRVYITVGRSTRSFFRDLVLVLVGRIFGHRIIGHVHGGDYGVFYEGRGPFMRGLVRFTLRRFERMLVLSEGLREMFAFEPAMAPRIEVVANGLPLTAATPRAGKRLPPEHSERRARIVFLSNLIESKGYFELLEATRYLVHERGLPVDVRFCGAFQTNRVDDRLVENARQAREMFESYVSEHELNEYVRYAGIVNGTEKIEELRAAHFFVLPTRYVCEGQPISIIEALAFGCVVVSSAYRAIPEVVENGVSGILLPAEDHTELGRVLGDLIEDPTRFAAISRAAIARFQSDFTREKHLQRLLPHLLNGSERHL